MLGSAKYCKERYLAKLMAHRRISVICYITFKTRISFNKHMKNFAAQLPWVCLQGLWQKIYNNNSRVLKRTSLPEISS